MATGHDLMTTSVSTRLHAYVVGGEMFTERLNFQKTNYSVEMVKRLTYIDLLSLFRYQILINTSVSIKLEGIYFLAQLEVFPN